MAKQQREPVFLRVPVEMKKEWLGLAEEWGFMNPYKDQADMNAFCIEMINAGIASKKQANVASSVQATFGHVVSQDDSNEQTKDEQDESKDDSKVITKRKRHVSNAAIKDGTFWTAIGGRRNTVHIIRDLSDNSTYCGQNPELREFSSERPYSDDLCSLCRKFYK